MLKTSLRLVVAVGAALLLAVMPVIAQTRSVIWERWDTRISSIDTRANRFAVVEDQRIRFDGSFTFGTRDFERGTLEGIEGLKIFVNGQALQNSCNLRARSFCVSTTSEYYEITYYFPSQVTDTTVDVRLEYTVIGALRVYTGGDQLWWDVLPEDRFGFPVNSSSIEVTLPTGFAPREGVDPVVTYGAPSDVSVNGTLVRAVARTAVPSGLEFSLRVQYPHDPQARIPAWQADWDVQRNFEETIQPLLTLALLGFSALIGIGGVLWTFIRYRTRGQDPEIGPVPEYLSEPPSELSPALVGTLLDEKADVRDVISILVDLARRGYIVIEESRTQGTIFSNSSFTFKRTDQPISDLRPFEQQMVNAMFRGASLERTLDSMRNVFYTVMARMQRDLHAEMVTQGFFDKNPDTTRSGWIGAGMVLILLAAIVGFFSIELVDSTGMIALWALPLAIGAVGLAFVLLSGGMPAKTRRGAEEAAKWGAFRKYLENIRQFNDVQGADAAEKFNRFLPYAVAFGLDKSWIGYFQSVPTMVFPPWYYPTYMGGPWSRGYHAGSPVASLGGGAFGSLRGDIATAGGDMSLDSLSGGLANGLESMSNGLSSMLTTAASVMTSRPQQSSSGSWSSGGRGFSGGGFRGGGGSGGGRAGFG